MLHACSLLRALPQKGVASQVHLDFLNRLVDDICASALAGRAESSLVTCQLMKQGHGVVSGPFLAYSMRGGHLPRARAGREREGGQLGWVRNASRYIPLLSGVDGSAVQRPKRWLACAQPREIHIAYWPASFVAALRGSYRPRLTLDGPAVPRGCCPCCLLRIRPAPPQSRVTRGIQQSLTSRLRLPSCQASCGPLAAAGYVRPLTPFANTLPPSLPRHPAIPSSPPCPAANSFTMGFGISGDLVDNRGGRHHEVSPPFPSALMMETLCPLSPPPQSVHTHCGGRYCGTSRHVTLLIQAHTPHLTHLSSPMTRTGRSARWAAPLRAPRAGEAA